MQKLWVVCRVLSDQKARKEGFVLFLYIALYWQA